MSDAPTLASDRSPLARVTRPTLSTVVSSPDVFDSGPASRASPHSNGLQTLPHPTHHNLSLASFHHALDHQVALSASSTPRPSARSPSRANNNEGSRSHSRASSADRTSSVDKSPPTSPPTKAPPCGSNTGGGATSAPIQRSSTIFDPLPALPSRLRQAKLKLVPPPNFGYVEDELYRSGEPAELSFPFLERLKLRTLVWLAPNPPGERFSDFMVLHHIAFHNLGIKHAASFDAVTDEAVTHALQVATNPASYPLIIMCSGGSHRTGTVVGCLRKLQRWNLASIFEEYRRYAGAWHNLMNEQFIEFYDTRVVTLPAFSLTPTTTTAAEQAPSTSLSGVSTDNENATLP